MNLNRQVALILQILQKWKDEIPVEEHNSTPLPVIAVPPEWHTAARATMGLKEGEDFSAIWNCSIVTDENLEVPFIIRHDGEKYSFAPEWRREAEASALERKRVQEARDKQAAKERKRVQEARDKQAAKESRRAERYEKSIINNPVARLPVLADTVPGGNTH